MSGAAGVTFAVATRLGGEMLLRCLAAARAEAERAGVRAEAVVVADGAPEESLAGIGEAFPDARILRHAASLGVGPSYNEALAASAAPLVALLNDDMEIEPGYLPAAIGAVEAPGVFAANPLVVRPTGETDHGRTALCDRDDVPEIVLHASETAGPALYASGGGLFRRELWAALGGFDPIFAPFYWEDVDLSYRAWASGHEVRFAPGARVLHRHRSTIDRVASDVDREAIEERNRWIFAWSNLTSPEWTRRLIRSGLGGVRRLRAAGRASAVEGFVRAHARLGAAVRRRRRLAAARRVSDEAILERVGAPVR